MKGFYGQIHRIQLSYDKSTSDQPKSVIAKFSSFNPEMRQRENTRAAYEREVRFYQEAPRETSLPIPECYYADIDKELEWHVILLEDLSPARSGSRVNGCTSDEARIAVRNIASIHAFWWDSPELDNYPWLRYGTVPRNEWLMYFRERMWSDFLRKLNEPLPDEVMKMGEALYEYLGAITEHIFMTKPITLIHSDYHLENILFGKQKGRDFFIIDWQLAGKGRGTWDIAYFISQSLKTEDRRNIEKRLLREYLEILHGNGVADYTIDDVLYDYRISLLHRFVNMVTTIAAMPFREEQIRMHAEVLLPRLDSAILDHDCPSLLQQLG